MLFRSYKKDQHGTKKVNYNNETNIKKATLERQRVIRMSGLFHFRNTWNSFIMANEIGYSRNVKHELAVRVFFFNTAQLIHASERKEFHDV